MQRLRTRVWRRSVRTDGEPNRHAAGTAQANKRGRRRIIVMSRVLHARRQGDRFVCARRTTAWRRYGPRTARALRVTRSHPSLAMSDPNPCVRDNAVLCAIPLNGLPWRRRTRRLADATGITRQTPIRVSGTIRSRRRRTAASEMRRRSVGDATAPASARAADPESARGSAAPTRAQRPIRTARYRHGHARVWFASPIE